MAVVAYLLCVLTVAIYCVWQLYQTHVFRRLVSAQPIDNGQQPTIAVVVPFRDEARHLARLLGGLLAQRYPHYLFEVILIDDHSTDASVRIIEEVCAAAGARLNGRAIARQGAVAQSPTPSITLLTLADELLLGPTVAHKKQALAMAISKANAEIIVTTDADCNLEPEWLHAVSKSFRAGTEAVFGLVKIGPLENFLDYFQYLDLAAYQFLTAVSVERGSPTLANGAAFAFRKSAFTRVGGYRGVDHLPSGDDVLLLHKFARAFPVSAFSYLATGPAVSTRPVAGWAALWKQRLRWAGKAGQYQSTYLVFAQYLTFFTCLACLLIIPLGWHLRSAALILLPWVAKMVVDYVNLRNVTRLYNPDQGVLPGSYLLTAIIYPFFIVAVGLATVAGVKPTWKGRPT